jgi:hypothetical protein
VLYKCGHGTVTKDNSSYAVLEVLYECGQSTPNHKTTGAILRPSSPRRQILTLVELYRNMDVSLSIMQTWKIILDGYGKT